jgi:peptidoglycan hydrolase-like protein with peptidoglycan-binding domain
VRRATARARRALSCRAVRKRADNEEAQCFGAQTETALKQFQSDFGLVDDGIAGPKTWAMLGS